MGVVDFDFEEIKRTAQMFPCCHNVQEQIPVHFNTTDNIFTITLDLNTNPAAATASHEQSNNVLNVATFVRQTSDNILMHVPTSIKERICEGEYINLSIVIGKVVILRSVTNNVGSYLGLGFFKSPEDETSNVKKSFALAPMPFKIHVWKSGYKNIINLKQIFSGWL